MTLTPDNTVIGFIGTGVMGKSMAGHLLKGGYKVMVYNRTPEKAQDLISQGALWEADLTRLAASCQVIITMVGYPRDVEEVYLGEHGLVHYAGQGTILIDMTTSSPMLAAKIFTAAQSKGLQVLDAPVSGGTGGAAAGTLTFMVGASAELFAELKPVLEQKLS